MQNQSSIKLTDVPFGMWLIGLVFLGGGIYFIVLRGFAVGALFAAGIGVVIILLNRVLTITADRNTRILQLQYWSLAFWRTTKEIPFDDIQMIRVASTYSQKGGRTYRVEVIRKDGSVVPFRTGYSSGSSSKQKIADQLRTFIGLGESFDESPAGLFRAVQQATAAQTAIQQEALTGPNEQEHITNGVHWQLQSTALGGMPATRWYSPDFKTTDGFVWVTQKMPGQSTRGILSALGKALFQKFADLYGFREDDIPNSSQAEMLDSVSPLFDQHFAAFTNLPADARQILNPWLQHPLADWGERHPVKQFQSQGEMAQLVILFSPNGVYLSVVGILQPEQVEELTALGLEMVKTQGATQAS